MKLELITEEHINKIYPFLRGEAKLSYYEFNKFIRKMVKSGPAYAVSHDSAVVALGGICIITKGVGHIWVAGTDLISKYPIGFTRISMIAFSQSMMEFDLHRVQAEVKWDYKSGLEWAKMMGFVEEGLMRQYSSNKEDYIRLALIKEDYV